VRYNDNTSGKGVDCLGKTVDGLYVQSVGWLIEQKLWISVSFHQSFGKDVREMGVKVETQDKSRVSREFLPYLAICSRWLASFHDRFRCIFDLLDSQ